MSDESKFLAKTFFFYTVIFMLAVCAVPLFDPPASAFKWVFIGLGGQVIIGAWLVWSVYFTNPAEGGEI